MKSGGFGFTLVELLIVMVLGIIISITLAAILINNSEIIYKQSSRVSQGLSLNDALTSIKNYIRQASSVAISYPETPPATYTSSSSQLVLKLAAIDSNGDIIQNTFDYVIYLKDGDKLKLLLIKDISSTRNALNSILAKNLDQLIFNYYDSTGTSVIPQDAKRVKVSVSLNQKAGSKYETNVATGEANLRND